MICLFSNTFQLQYFLNAEVFYKKNYLVWEIIVIDEFWLDMKSSSGLVDFIMWKKNGLILVDMFKLSHDM